MIDRLVQSLQTIGPVGIFACLVAGGILALIAVLARK